MSTKQGLGHEDPPISGGYTGMDRSRIGGLGHVCGMYCDGQDRGGGCDVQDEYYKKRPHLYGEQPYHHQVPTKAALTGAIGRLLTMDDLERVVEEKNKLQTENFYLRERITVLENKALDSDGIEIVASKPDIHELHLRLVELEIKVKDLITAVPPRRRL